MVRITLFGDFHQRGHIVRLRPSNRDETTHKSSFRLLRMNLRPAFYRFSGTLLAVAESAMEDPH
jgi:hypothetical protein